MPAVTVVGSFDEVHLGNSRNEIKAALSGQASQAPMRLHVRETTSRFVAPSETCFITTNTELYTRLGRLRYEALEQFGKALQVAIEQWNPKGRKEIEVEFLWAPERTKRLRVSHERTVRGATTCHALTLSLV